MSIHIYTIYYTILAYKLIAFGSISPGLDFKSVQLGLVVNMTIYIYIYTHELLNNSIMHYMMLLGSKSIDFDCKSIDVGLIADIYIYIYKQPIIIYYFVLRMVFGSRTIYLALKSFDLQFVANMYIYACTLLHYIILKLHMVLASISVDFDLKSIDLELIANMFIYMHIQVIKYYILLYVICDRWWRFLRPAISDR